MTIEEGKKLKKIWKRSNLIDISEIEESERLIGMSLPKDYKELVKDNDGGRACFIDENGETISRSIYVEKWRQSITPHLISHKVEDGCKVSRFYWNYMDDRDILPKEVVTFAYDSGGNLLVFDFKDNPHDPKIFFVDHEEYIEIDLYNEWVEVGDVEKGKTLEDVQREEMMFVANSFSEFLEKLSLDESDQFIYD